MAGALDPVSVSSRVELEDPSLRAQADKTIAVSDDERRGIRISVGIGTRAAPFSDRFSCS